MNLKEYYKQLLSRALVEDSIAVGYGRSPARRPIASPPPNSGTSNVAAQTTGTPPDPNGIAYGTQDKGRGPDRGKPVTQEEAIYAQEVAQYSRPGGVTIPATAPVPAATPTAVPRRDGQIDNNPVLSPVNGRPLSINPNDGSFNISPAARAQAQTNRDAISTGRAETGSGLSRMARGADGRPVSSYVNPNSPEGRVEASIAAGKEPDLQRDPNTGRLDPTRSARNLDRDATAAGNAAFDTSVKTNLGIDNASGMSKSDLESKARDVRRQDTSRVEGEVRAADVKKNGQMPTDAVGSNTQAMRIAKEQARRDALVPKVVPAALSRQAPPTETDRGEIPYNLRNPEHDNLPSAAFGQGQNPARWQQARNDEITKATNAGRARSFDRANTNTLIASNDQSRTPQDYIMSPTRADGTYSKIPNEAPDLIKKEEPSQVISQNAAIAARKAARIRGTSMDPRGKLFR